MTSLTVLRVRELAKKMMKTMKKNEAQSAHAESTHKGVNQHSLYVTQVQRQRPESATVTLTWQACKYKVHKLHLRYILKVTEFKKSATKTAKYTLETMVHVLPWQRFI